MIARLFTVVLLALMADQPALAPAQERSTELAFVVVTSYQCPCNAAGIDRAVAEMHQAALAGATAPGLEVRLIGVAIGASAEDGATYLLKGITSDGDTLQFPKWDEIHTGRGWLNDTVLSRLVQDSQAILAYPQAIVLQRQFTMSPDRPVVDETVLARLVGIAAIRDFKLPGG